MNRDAPGGGGLQLITLFFGEKFLQVRTDVDEVAQFVRQSHRAMVLDEDAAPDRIMTILRSGRGFVFDGDFFDDVSSPAFLFDLILLRLATAFVELRSDLLWLHSAAAARDNKAVLIVGESGAGKSTLVTHLCEMGWMFLSDEMAPLDMKTRAALPYPRTPTRRIDPGRQIDRGEVFSLERENCPLPDNTVAREKVPVGAIVFPRFEHAAPAELHSISPGHASLEVLRCCNNFPQHRGTGVESLALLVNSIPCRTITYGNGRHAATVLHDLGNDLFVGGGSMQQDSMTSRIP